MRFLPVTIWAEQKKTGDRNQESGDRSRKAESRRQESGDRRRKSEDRSQESEVRIQETEKQSPVISYQESEKQLMSSK